jgi:hypothetical protein
MGWEVLIIPIIGVAVWIISTLVRGAEEAKGNGPPRPAAQRRPERVTDLDRFLREVQRRKRGAGREEEEAEERPQRAEREEEPPPRTERRRESPRRTPPPPREEKVFVPPPAAAVPAPPPVAPPAVVEELLPAAPPVAAGLAGLRHLLRSREGLRTAVILQEVLGPPVSRRGRGR